MPAQQKSNELTLKVQLQRDFSIPNHYSPTVMQEDQQAALEKDIRLLCCPHCEEKYSTFAIIWAMGWMHGYSMSTEQNFPEHKSIRLKCELCGGQAEFDRNNSIITAIGQPEESLY